MILRSDCRHFPGDRPCRFNKESGQTCPDCHHYTPQGVRILIIKLAALGDVLRTTAILPGVKEQFPDSYIVWLTLREAIPLLKGNPLVDEIWSVEDDLPTRFDTEAFDVVLNPDADKRAAGLATKAKAPEKRGLLLDIRGCLRPTGPGAATWLEMGAFDQFKKANNRTYQELIYEMLELPYGRQPLVLRLTEEEREEARTFLAQQGWQANDRLVGLNVGGGGRWKKKRWKEASFLELARRLADELGVRPLLIGGAAEQDFMLRLQDALPVGGVCAGPNRSLRQTAALIGCCRVLVTGDTLAFHLATAQQVPVIVLLGPTSAAELDVYGRGAKIVSPIPCIGCYLTDCDIDPDCMQLISASHVFEAVKPFVTG